MGAIDFKDIIISEKEFSSIDLSDILDLITKGDYKKASELSLQEIEKGFFDIRLISYYVFGLCYSDFETKGNYSFQFLAEVFAQFENLKPAKFKEKQCKNALNWFISSLMDRLEFRESKGNRLTFNKEILGAYQCFETSVSNALAEMDAAAVKFRRFIVDRIEDEDTKIVEALPDENCADSNSPLLEKSNFNGGSGKWQSLLDKIKVLDILQSKDAEVEAAVLYRHIYHLLSSFNPLEYFPEYLAPFYQKILDPNFQSIIDKTESHITSVQWTALEGLVASDHRLLLNGQCRLLKEGHSVTQEKFRSLIETDHFRNMTPHPNSKSSHADTMSVDSEENYPYGAQAENPYDRLGTGMPAGGPNSDPSARPDHYGPRGMP
tara:strand:- start:616 stop:1749 length:1134 start_codon:yes stop_codon:yes gene_type:complete